MLSFHDPRPGDRRIGVVDVGSNSVRMVVFEGGRRCPANVFNEKVMCGLGADLARTGKLSPEGCDRALAALARFLALAPGLKLSALAGVATAAVREAEDGEDFRDRVANQTNIRLRIASGVDEARLAAQGVLFGDPAAAGLVFDLGGASMELCPVNAVGPGRGVTTPLGPQRFGDMADRKAARETIRETLAPFARRFAGASHQLYLVGGAWRAFGRVQIEWSGHPLPILHEFAFTPDQAAGTISDLLSLDGDGLSQLSMVSSARRATLPHAALLLEQMIEVFGPERIQLSGFGLREGVCYDILTDDLRAEDPLLSTAMGHERTRARAPGFGTDLAEWLLPVLPPRDRREERLIRAVCHLADVSWRAHPDFRATACREVVTRINLSSAGHIGRAFMLAALISRYSGSRRVLETEPAIALLEPDTLLRARQIGTLMRLGATLAAGMPGYLHRCPVAPGAGALTLRPTAGGRMFLGEEVEKRLDRAARLLGLVGTIETD